MQNKISIALTAGCIISLYFLLYYLVGMGSMQTSQAAITQINDSAITLLNVTNYVPRVVGVILDDTTAAPANEIDLTAGTFRRIFCNGTVIDYNGKNDIVACNATIFFTGNKSSQQNDNNEHYSNNSCTITKESTYNRTYSCSFRVWYYANNGTWHCNMSAWDNGTANLNGLRAYNSSTDTAKIQPLYALDVPNVISFGNMALNETSTSKKTNVTNIGNMNLDLRLYGYGGNVKQENNLSFKCKIGNITAGLLRFAINGTGTAYPSMRNLSGQFANPNQVNFNLGQRRSESLNLTNYTYFRMRVPQFGVKGTCNGTIIFNAVQG